ncbi:MAG: AAA family ATPase [Pseudomonadota bacterium]
MDVLCVLTQKGGSGKTTIATSMAVASQMAGRSSAIFDLDSQASACFWSDIRAASEPPVRDCMIARLPSYLEKIAAAGYDLAVLDCPPVNYDIAYSAASAADYVLIPTRADVLDVASMRKTLEVVQTVERPHSVVLNFCPPSGGEVPSAKRVLAQMGAKLCPVQLSYLKAFPRGQQTGQSAIETEPNSKAAQQLRDLYAFILDELKATKGQTNVEKETRPARRSA